jgi:hypothetical protein
MSSRRSTDAGQVATPRTSPSLTGSGTAECATNSSAPQICTAQPLLVASSNRSSRLDAGDGWKKKISIPNYSNGIV